MPFDSRMHEVYEQIYKPVCEKHGVSCWRVDEIARPGSITKDIVNGIIDSDVVIADLTGRNANVFYELGIAHSVGNKTIMTAQRIEDVPFDIGNYRVILYDQTIAGSKKLDKALSNALSELLASFEQTNNPVQEVLSVRGVGGLPRRVPIIQAINYGSLHKGLRNLFEKEGIRFVDDLKKLCLEEVKQKHDLGVANLSTLVRLILKFGAFDDLNAIQSFAMKNKLRTADDSDEFYSSSFDRLFS